jgi:hypothetical protein
MQQVLPHLEDQTRRVLEGMARGKAITSPLLVRRTLISSYSGASSTYESVFQSHLIALYDAGSGSVGSISADTAVAKSESKKNR